MENGANYRTMYRIRQALEMLLNKPQNMPPFVDRITVDRIEPGKKIPKLSDLVLLETREPDEQVIKIV